MENAKISNLYDLNETIAKEYLEQFTTIPLEPKSSARWS